MRTRRGRWRSKISTRSLAGGMATLHERNRTETDGDPVPGIDGGDEQRELHLLGIVELRLERRIVAVRRVSLRDERQGLGPGERRPLPLRIDRSFAPGVEQVKTLLALAIGPGIPGMHFDAVGAA